MSDLALTTANKINVGTSGPNVQITGVAGAAITAGSPVCYDGTNDRFIVSDANDAAADAVVGIATHTAATGEALTVIRRGLMDGWSNLPVPGSLVYLSNTAGALADTASASITLAVGIVVPVFGAPLGTAADRALMVEITGVGKSA